MCTPFDLNGLLCLTQSQRLRYKIAWDIFEKIQNINSNVSTIKSVSSITIPYYTYTTYNEKEQFTLGQYLHTQVYPNVVWNTVQEN